MFAALLLAPALAAHAQGMQVAAARPIPMLVLGPRVTVPRQSLLSGQGDRVGSTPPARHRHWLTELEPDGPSRLAAVRSLLDEVRRRVKDFERLLAQEQHPTIIKRLRLGIASCERTIRGLEDEEWRLVKLRVRDRLAPPPRPVRR